MNNSQAHKGFPYTLSGESLDVLQWLDGRCQLKTVFISYRSMIIIGKYLKGKISRFFYELYSCL